MAEQGSSLTDLKDALKETLEARGSLGQIKARIRAEIFAALDDESAPKPKLSNENLLINELIREYLAYNGYAHALSVFVAESGHPLEPTFRREVLAHELRVDDDPRFVHVPLLYGIVTSLQHPRELGQLNTSNAERNPAPTTSLPTSTHHFVPCNSDIFHCWGTWDYCDFSDFA